MNASELQELISHGETISVEFKRGRLKDMNDAQIVEAVTCLANGEGGTLIIGVTDSGIIEGAAHRHRNETKPSLLRAMITNRTEPPLPVEVQIVSIDSKELIIIEVPQSTFPVGTSQGQYLRRVLQPNGEPECRPYPLHAMMSQAYVAQGTDYAAVAAPHGSDKLLDPLEFERLRQLSATGRGDRSLADLTDQEILRALRLTRPEDPERVTLGAVLLFGTEAALESTVPTHEVLFQELERGQIVYSETLRTPLFSTAERINDLLTARNTEEEVMWGLFRVGIPRIPVATIRESIANALVHRDYTTLGSILIQLDEESLTVKSPGGFPLGVTPENILDASQPRSPILADAFKRAGMVDRAGRGVREMYEDLLRSGKGVPDYRQSTRDTVVLKIPTADADRAVVRFIAEYETQQNSTLSLTELRILRSLHMNGAETTADLASELMHSSDALKPSLTKLQKRGLIDATGRGRSRSFTLSASFYRLSGDTEYIRLQEIDTVQQEQLIMNYVRQYDSITRSVAAELCHITPAQASLKLRDLAARNKLMQVGERRWTKYVLHPSEHSTAAS